MRMRSRVALGAGLVLVAVVAADLPLSYHGAGSLRQQQLALTQQIARDQSQGLPPATATKLRAQLAAVDTTQWWSPTFLLLGQSQRIADIRLAAGRDWAKAVAVARTQATTFLTSYQKFVDINSAWLSAPASGPPKSWSVQLAAASTPGSLESLVEEIQVALTQDQAQVQAAQAKAASSVTLAQAPGGLLQEATQLEAIAKSDGLSPLQVPQAAAALQQALSAGQPGIAQTASLTDQLTQLRAEVGLNDQLVQQSHSVMDLVDQAAAEQTPGSATYLASYQSSQSALTAAQTAAQLASVQQTLNSVQQGVQQSLTGDPCGHSTISGKSILISLSLQEMVFYDNGCEVQATPVTTGRPLLRTPTGTFSIFDKQSPYVFISPWPPGSPFWYPTSPVNYVMEFAQGGYYIHDAPWEPTSEYGPGSQNIIPAASHGCVQTPGVVMAWAYSWTPMGTPVVIVN
ncbi:MAG: L,D-transpeptidase [Candidatus Dormibacteria bacterium]